MPRDTLETAAAPSGLRTPVVVADDGTISERPGVLYGRADSARIDTARKLAKIEGCSEAEMLATLDRMATAPRVTLRGAYLAHGGAA